MSHLTYIEREVVACFLALLGIVGVILTFAVWSDRRLIRRRKAASLSGPPVEGHRTARRLK